MKEHLAEFLSNESYTALPWGLGGGAVAAMVLKSHPVEMIGRIAVGGITAAAVAPYLASEVLHMETGSAAYPFLCCSIGILGYQMVRVAIENPDRIPIIGKMLAAHIAREIVQPTPAAAAPPALPPIPQPPAHEQSSSWETTVLPPEPPRPRIRVPLSPQ